MSQASNGLATSTTHMHLLIKNEQIACTTFRLNHLVGSQVISTSYHKVVFSNCVFFGVQFKDILFTDCIFENCTFEFSHMDNCKLQHCLFENCQWMAATTKETVVLHGSMDGATLDTFLAGEENQVYMECEAEELLAA
jgi:uncharacterized protein YjbI with pentapeptide repeats